MTKNDKATPIKLNFYEKILFIVLFGLCVPLDSVFIVNEDTQNGCIVRSVFIRGG